MQHETNEKKLECVIIIIFLIVGVLSGIALSECTFARNVTTVYAQSPEKEEITSTSNKGEVTSISNNEGVKKLQNQQQLMLLNEVTPLSAATTSAIEDLVENNNLTVEAENDKSSENDNKTPEINEQSKGEDEEEKIQNEESGDKEETVNDSSQNQEEKNSDKENSKGEEKESSERKVSKKKGITICTLRKISMYSEDDTDSKVIQELDAGDKLQNVVESGYGWLKATYNGKRGYVYYLYTNYVQKRNSKRVVYKSILTNTKGYLTGDSVNFREAPGVDTKVKKSLKVGTEFKIIAYEELLKNEEDGWYEVELKNGKTGYIYGQYIYVDVDITIPTVQGSDNNKSNIDTSSENKVDKELIEQLVEDGAEINQEILDKYHVKKSSKKSKSKKSKKEAKADKKDNKATERKQKKSDKEDESSKKDLNETEGKQKTSQKEEKANKKNVKVTVNEKDVELLAKVMKQEAGGSGDKEMKFVAQTLINRVTINKSSLEEELAKPNQYPVTWKKIKDGKVKATKHIKKLAREILEGKNGFEGTRISKSKWDKIYYQTQNNPSSWVKEVVFYSGNHYYSI